MRKVIRDEFYHRTLSVISRPSEFEKENIKMLLMKNTIDFLIDQWNIPFLDTEITLNDNATTNTRV